MERIDLEAVFDPSRLPNAEWWLYAWRQGLLMYFKTTALILGTSMIRKAVNFIAFAYVYILGLSCYILLPYP